MCVLVLGILEKETKYYYESYLDALLFPFSQCAAVRKVYSL